MMPDYLARLNYLAGVKMSGEIGQCSARAECEAVFGAVPAKVQWSSAADKATVGPDIARCVTTDCQVWVLM